MFLLCYLAPGIGASMTSASIPIVVNMYFDKKRSLATSMTLLVNGLGSVVFAPLVTYFFYHYGYEGTLLLLGGMGLHGCLSASVYRTPRKSKKCSDLKDGVDSDTKCMKSDEMDVQQNISSSANENEMLNNEKRSDMKNATPIMTIKTKLSKILQYSDLRVLMKPRFAAFTLMMTVASLCLSMNGVVVAEFCRERDASAIQIAAMLSVSGLISIPVRLAYGLACDRPVFRKHRGGLFGVVVMMTGWTITLAPLTSNVVELFVWFATSGVATAGMTSMETLVIADVLGREKLPDGVGLSRFARGLGILIGPTVGGRLASISSYTPALPGDNTELVIILLLTGFLHSGVNICKWLLKYGRSSSHVLARIPYS